MGGAAKVVAVAIAVVVFVVVYGLLALYYPRFDAILKNRWKRVALFAAGPFGVTLLVVLPLLGEGIAGSRSGAGAPAAAVSTALGSLTYALVLELAYREFSKTHASGFDISRRKLLRASVGLVLFASLLVYALNNFVFRGARLVFSSAGQLQANEITPNDQFYVVSKNLSDPVVNPSTYSLAIDGLVDRRLEHSVQQLLDRPQSQEIVTLECVSNEVGGSLISSARWSGVPLRGLIDEAGPQPSADWCLFTCDDGYTVGVPLLRARSPEALLALHMNGDRLPAKHGYPARVLVPGLYGMFHAKWVRQVTLVTGEVEGFWQKKGWTNRGEIRTTAIVAVAPEQVPTGVPVALGGVAFAGTRGVSKVEVSVDGGATWREAQLKAPLSAYAWTLWTLEWTPTGPGRVRIQARATDGIGAVQEAVREPPYPNGAAGYDAVEVIVSG